MMETDRVKRYLALQDPGELARLMDYDVEAGAGAGTDTLERAFLYSLALMAKARTIVEIGVYRGFSTAYLAAAAKQAAAENEIFGGSGAFGVIAVDDWSGDSGGDAKDPWWARERLKRHGLLDAVEFRSIRSDAFFADAPDRSADMVWVDGCHWYDVAKADIISALRVARNVVAVHDMRLEMSDVRTAVAEIEDELGIRGVWLNGHHGLWVYQIPQERRLDAGKFGD